MKLKNTGAYRLGVTDVSGKVLMQEKYIVQNKVQSHAVSIPETWSNGIYFITIYDERSKVINTSRLVVR